MKISATIMNIHTVWKYFIQIFTLSCWGSRIQSSFEPTLDPKFSTRKNAFEHFFVISKRLIRNSYPVTACMTPELHHRFGMRNQKKGGAACFVRSRKKYSASEKNWVNRGESQSKTTTKPSMSYVLVVRWIISESMWTRESNVKECGWVKVLFRHITSQKTK